MSPVRIALVCVSPLILALMQSLVASPPAQGLPVSPDVQVKGQAWWAHVKVLADDNMHGRLTGTEDYSVLPGMSYRSSRTTGSSLRV